MLMANIGRVVYPSYTVNRQRAVFKDRDALMRYINFIHSTVELQWLEH